MVKKLNENREWFGLSGLLKVKVEGDCVCLPADRSRGLRGVWGSGLMGTCSLGASEPSAGAGCRGSAMLDNILSPETGAAPSATSPLIPPG